MNVTRDIVNDLVPLYLAGEASADTRALIESYLRDHPDFARTVQESAARASRLLEASPWPSPDLEAVAFDRIRQFVRRRANVLGFAMAFSVMPFSFAFDGSHVRWMMLRDSPAAACAFWIAAIALWTLYAFMERRVRSDA